jgi:CheY-like chemotaxis protein
VLLVDDDDALRALITEILRGAGADVLASDEGRKALELMGEWPPQVVLLDLSMHGMNGAEFRKEQRSRPRMAAVPVIIMTAAPDPAVAGDHLLRKPFSREELLHAVGRFVPALRPRL